MEISIIRGANFQQSQRRGLHRVSSLIASQEELIEAGTGIGRFHHMVNGEPVLIPDRDYGSRSYRFPELYYQILEDQKPVPDDVYAAILLEDRLRLQTLIPAVFHVNIRNVKFGTPLSYAYRKGRLEMFRLLLEMKADVNARLTADGETLLHIAVRSDDNLPFVQLLIMYGADPNAMDDSNNTPLMLAKSIPMITYLLENKADMNIKNDDHVNIFLRAIGCSNIELIELLLFRGANIDQQDKLGNTPLIVAVTVGQLESVKVLLHHGANKEIRNWRGRTAEMIARRTDENEIADVIRDYYTDLIKEPVY